jgi:ATP/maltotriose-dependent transcriptional regulator MalT
MGIGWVTGLHPDVRFTLGEARRGGYRERMADGSAPARPLVASKLQPPVPRRHVSRPELLRACRAGSRKLTLLRAPAGWGKTTLLADWHAAPDERRPFAWLALDRDDNDPVRFWTYLVEALRTCRPAAGERSLATLAAPRVDIVADVVPLLFDELARQDDPVVLVLDDYHLVTNPEIDRTLAYFVDHLPHTLELVVATRSEPPLALPRMRARGELVEIDAAQLSFTDAEAELLLNGLNGLGLDPATVTRLRRRTEGWAAGLYLAALTLRDRVDPAAFIRDFAGDDRHVVDYLSAEVLTGLPDDVRDFLLHTSPLERFCASLCDAVTGRHSARRILRELETSNFFLVPLDTRREWYRYHHLFGELLRHELQAAEPELARTLHRRAWQWHRGHGLPAEAIRHATAAGDADVAAEIILDHWLDARDGARLETLLSWLDGLPAGSVTADARLCLVMATTLQELGRIDDAQRWLDRAAEGAPAHPVPPAALAACRAINQYFLGDARGICRTAEPVLTAADPGGEYWRSALLTTLGTARFALGRGADAAAALGEAVAAGEASGHALALVHALGWYVVVLAENGHRGPADRAMVRLEALLRDRPGLAVYYGAAMAHIGRAALSDGGPAGADDADISRGIELARRGDAKFEQLYGLVVRARLCARRGDRGTAARCVAEAEAVIAACVDAGDLPRLVASLRIERGVGAAVRRAPLEYGEVLSDRELAVLRLLGTGLTQREIGAHLSVSFNTVKTHTKSIFRKLGVSSRGDAVRRAGDLGLG